MVVYVDIAFLLNCLTDGAALYATGRLSGLPVGRRRLHRLWRRGSEGESRGEV